MTEQTKKTDYVCVMAFDGVLDQKLQNTWRALARNEVADDQLKFSYHPHMTLVSTLTSDGKRLSDGKPFDIKKMIKHVQKLVTQWKAVPLSLDNMCLIPQGNDRTAVVIRPKRNDAVFPLQKAITDSWTPEIPYHKSDVWSGHITIAKSVPNEKLGKAISIVSDTWAPVEQAPDRVEIFELDRTNGVGTPKILWSFKLNPRNQMNHG